MIADDFTGALDSGVQFAKAGLKVEVVTDIQYDFRAADETTQILVLDAETRHVSKEDAYDTVYQITRRGCECGIPYLYKKTDSALRGNIGSELQAMLEASGQPMLPFFPALPAMKRITRGGIQYIDGIPVKNSVFGEDPFNPVICSYVPDIIHLQSQTETAVVPEGEDCGTWFRGIAVFDAESGEKISAAAGHLLTEGRLSVMAGCAGLASILPELLGIRGRNPEEEPDWPGGLFVVNGSVNPITRRQIDYAERHGFYREYLSAEAKLREDYWESAEGKKTLERLIAHSRSYDHYILDANDFERSGETLSRAQEDGLSLAETRRRITRSIGRMVQAMMEAGIHKTLMLVGGDTLMGSLDQLGVKKMTPFCELFAGSVLSRFAWNGEEYLVISKSGGFGERTLIRDIADRIEEHKEEKAIC